MKKLFDSNLIEEFHLSFNAKYKIKITSAKLDRLRKNHIYLYVQIFQLFFKLHESTKTYTYVHMLGASGQIVFSIIRDYMRLTIELLIYKLAQNF